VGVHRDPPGFAARVGAASKLGAGAQICSTTSMPTRIAGQCRLRRACHSPSDAARRLPSKPPTSASG
ncbi:MAG: hypothetical protein JW751_29545, partial [Polyangiaceae bacterium]|nr:hypothetical protein [Polyangiaceae bacterium]